MTHPSALSAVDALLARIEQYEPSLHSLLEILPGIREAAAAADSAPLSGRGPLHGVPLLIKGNVNVAGVATTAGSLALAGIAPPATDAPVVARLGQAGALILGTTNLSEWANLRSSGSSSGWSAVGGQCRNPHALDRSPGGSSAGSGAAVAAGFAPGALGSETDGSILCPAALNGVVGVKPTLGLVPTDGVIPISASQDVVGPITRSVAEAALLLQVISGGQVNTNLDPDALRGRRIGVGRQVYTGYDSAADEAFEQALAVLSRLGATIVDPADITTAAALRDEPAEMTVLLCEFKDDLAAYLATRPGAPPDLDALIAFNLATPAELAIFGQDLFEQAAATGGRADPAYAPARARCLQLARTEGIDATLARHALDALVWPTYPVAWPIGAHQGGDGAISGAGSTPTAVAGYPAVTVPSGLAGRLPVGLQFSGPAGSDGLLLSLAYAYEQATHHLVAPSFAATA